MVDEVQQTSVASATTNSGGGRRTAYKPLSKSTPGDGYCSDAISASQVEQLMDSLQHVVAMGDNDDEVQLVNQAVSLRRRNSPGDAELVTQRDKRCAVGGNDNTVILQTAVLRERATLNFPQSAPVPEMGPASSSLQFFRFVTDHAFDRRTDGQTEFSSLDHVCISCSAVKIGVHQSPGL